VLPVFAAKFVSPLYVAVIGCMPAINAVVLIVATPFVSPTGDPSIAPSA
jgi:hypothetical protein